MPAAGAVAMRTRHVDIGVGIAIAPLHNPLRLAEDCAVVDNLSGGRLILGVGIGYRDEEYAGYDVQRSARAGFTEESHHGHPVRRLRPRAAALRRPGHPNRQWVGIRVVLPLAAIAMRSGPSAPLASLSLCRPMFLLPRQPERRSGSLVRQPIGPAARASSRLATGVFTTNRRSKLVAASSLRTDLSPLERARVMITTPSSGTSTSQKV